MKVIPISNIEFFEFQSTDEICKNTHDEIRYGDFDYVSNGPANTVENFSSNGYRKLGDGQITFFYYKPLFDWINECLQIVTKQYFTSGNLEICDSWVVKTKFGEVSSKHQHALSLFSGLYYITDHDTSETVFHFDDPVYNFFEPYYGETVMKKNNYNFISKPKSGKLLIWPSYIQHHVNLHRDKTTRYTVAFNTELTGVISPFRTCYSEKTIKGSVNQESLTISKTKKYIPT